MLENIKNYLIFNYVDKCVSDKNYDGALEKLNYLVQQDFNPNQTFLKRGILCKKLLMLDEAYADFTYIITHCVDKQKAYFERMKLNFEISNYYESISDANKILETIPDNLDCKRYKILSYAYSGQVDLAKSLVLDLYDSNKYKAMQFIFNETAMNIAEDNLAKAIKLLEVIELIDPDNPIKIFKEANIYGIAGDKSKQDVLLKKLDSVFPKYFISHFKFTDIYAERDLLEISFLLELKAFDKQCCFDYPMYILDGYKCYQEGHIIDAKEAFESAVKINPNKPEAYVLLAQILQIMSGYDNSSYKDEAEKNYKKAMSIYQQENLTAKTEDMKRQIKHLNSTLSFQ